MNPAISLELQFFLTSILWGVILLIVYDILRIFRRLIKHDEFFVALEDMIFWVLASLFIFAMIYHMNNGVIRGFSVMGMVLGGVLYHFAISDLLVNWMAKLIKMLLKPVSMILIGGKRLFGIVFLKVHGIIKKLLYRLKNLVKSVKITLKKRIRKPEKRKKSKTSKKPKKTKGPKDLKHPMKEENPKEAKKRKNTESQIKKDKEDKKDKRDRKHPDTDNPEKKDTRVNKNK